MEERLKIGEIFEGRYRVEAPLGAGGFATVYRAVQVDLLREVALKILRAPPGVVGPTAEDEVWLDRFRREARLVAQLRDPRSITMYDFGTTREGTPYMVFEFVHGRDLARVIQEEAPLAPERVASILIQCLSSLREAHHLGVLHRDLKPANVLLYDHLGDADQVKVLDFGIAKPMNHEDLEFTTDLTQDDRILGTPRYMSPEQLQGEALTPASDLYSLGLVAYELLTGARAIRANKVVLIIGEQLSHRPIRLPAGIGGEALRAVIHKLVERRPADRYQSAQEVMAVLRSLGTGATDSVGGTPSLVAVDGEPVAGEPTVTGPTVAMRPSVAVIEAWLWEAEREGAKVVQVEPTGEGYVARYRTRDGESRRHPLSTAEFERFDDEWTRVSTSVDGDGFRRTLRGGPADQSGELQILYQRLETLGGRHGTLHLYGEREVGWALVDLVSTAEELRTFQRWCEASEGIVIFSGKGGSGKTSTAYGCMKEVATSTDRTVFSIEGRAGHVVRGINQLEIDLDDREAFGGAIKRAFTAAAEVIFIGSSITVDDPSYLWRPALSAAEDGRLVFLQVDAVSAADALEKLSAALPRPVEEHIVGVCWQELQTDEGGRTFAVYEFFEPGQGS